MIDNDSGDIVVAGERTEADFLAYYNFMLSQRRSYHILLFVCIALIAIGFGYIYNNIIAGVTTLIIGSIVIGMLYVRARNKRMRAWIAEDRKQQPLTYRFNDQGLRTTSALLDSKVVWRYFDGYRETPAEFILLAGLSRAILLPKRWFTDDALSRLRDLLEHHLKHVAKP